MTGQCKDIGPDSADSLSLYIYAKKALDLHGAESRLSCCKAELRMLHSRKELYQGLLAESLRKGFSCWQGSLSKCCQDSLSDSKEAMKLKPKYTVMLEQLGHYGSTPEALYIKAQLQGELRKIESSLQHTERLIRLEQDCGLAKAAFAEAEQKQLDSLCRLTDEIQKSRDKYKLQKKAYKRAVQLLLALKHSN